MKKKNINISDVYKEIKRYAKAFLETQGGFYPYGIAVDRKNKIISIGAYDGDEFPMSQKLIDILEKGIATELSKGTYQMGIICIDVFLHDTQNGIKTTKNAIELRIKTTSENRVEHLIYEIDEPNGVVFLN